MHIGWLQEFLIRTRSSVLVHGTGSSTQANLNFSTVWQHLMMVSTLKLPTWSQARGMFHPTFSRTAAQKFSMFFSPFSVI